MSKGVEGENKEVFKNAYFTLGIWLGWLKIWPGWCGDSSHIQKTNVAGNSPV